MKDPGGALLILKSPQGKSDRRNAAMKMTIIGHWAGNACSAMHGRLEALSARRHGWRTAAGLALVALLAACGHAPMVGGVEVSRTPVEKPDTLVVVYRMPELKRTVTERPGYISGIPIQRHIALNDTAFEELGRWMIESAPSILARRGIALAGAYFVEQDQAPPVLPKGAGEVALPVLVIVPQRSSVSGNGHATMASHTFSARLLAPDGGADYWRATVQTGSWEGNDLVMRNLPGYRYDEAYAASILETVLGRLAKDGMLKPVLRRTEAPVPTARGSALASAPVAAGPQGWPVFSQVLVVSVPEGFALASEEATDGTYARTLLPPGESSKNWTRRLSYSAARGLSRDSGATLAGHAARLLSPLKAQCTSGYAEKVLTSGEQGGVERHVVVAACAAFHGRAGGETALVSVVRGTQDYYAVEWREKTAGVDPAASIRPAGWIDAYRKIGAIRPCDPAAGEAAPYASCLAR